MISFVDIFIRIRPNMLYILWNYAYIHYFLRSFSSICFLNAVFRWINASIPAG